MKISQYCVHSRNHCDRRVPKVERVPYSLVATQNQPFATLYITYAPQRGDKNDVVERSCFTPDPGFVVKTSLAQPYHGSTVLHGRADGVGGAARKISESAPTGTKVFINICSHEGVPPPKDQVGSKGIFLCAVSRSLRGGGGQGGAQLTPCPRYSVSKNSQDFRERANQKKMVCSKNFPFLPG